MNKQLPELHANIRVEFDVPGTPIPKARPRVYHGQGITPKRTRDAEQRIRDTFTSLHPDMTPFDQPVRLETTFWMTDYRVCDVDNLVKLVQDALNTIAYTDDRWIHELYATVRRPDTRVPGKRGPRKRRAGDPLTWFGGHYKPHTHITITTITTNK